MVLQGEAFDGVDSERLNNEQAGGRAVLRKKSAKPPISGLPVWTPECWRSQPKGLVG